MVMHISGTVQWTNGQAWVKPVQGQRMDQVLWKRKLADLLQASDTQLIKLLRQDGLLQD